MMKKKNAQELLLCYVSKTIKPSEWDELKTLLEYTGDEQLSDVLNLIWENAEYPQKNIPTEDIIEKIYEDVRNRTQDSDQDLSGSKRKQT